MRGTARTKNRTRSWVLKVATLTTSYTVATPRATNICRTSARPMRCLDSSRVVSSNTRLNRITANAVTACMRKKKNKKKKRKKKEKKEKKKKKKKKKEKEKEKEKKKEKKRKKKRKKIPKTSMTKKMKITMTNLFRRWSEKRGAVLNAKIF